MFYFLGVFQTPSDTAFVSIKYVAARYAHRDIVQPYPQPPAWVAAMPKS